MATSKTFLLLAAAFTLLLVISSEVSARELAETTQIQGDANLDGRKDGYGYGGGHGGYGGGHGGYGGGHGGYGGGHGGYGGGHGGYGGGHGGYGGGHGGHHPPHHGAQEVETEGGN